jgi:hypothetical protein
MRRSLRVALGDLLRSKLTLGCAFDSEDTELVVSEKVSVTVECLKQFRRMTICSAPTLVVSGVGQTSTCGSKDHTVYIKAQAVG